MLRHVLSLCLPIKFTSICLKYEVSYNIYTTVVVKMMTGTGKNGIILVLWYPPGEYP